MPCGTKKRTKQPSSRVKAVRVPIQTKSRSFVAYNNYDYYPNLGRELHPYEIPVYISSISGYEIPDKYQQAQYHLIHAHYPKFSEKKTPKIFSYTGIPHNKLERVLVKHENIQKTLNKSDPNYEMASANAIYEIRKFARHKRVTKGRKSHRS